MKRMVFVIVFGLLCSGCARILLPYHENFLCNRGAETGYCGSLRQVYEETIREEQGENNQAVNILKGEGTCACRVSK